MKNTKKALLLSCLSMLLCLSMLVGSTFAWFTDTASTSVNRIVAGTLDIGLYRGIYSASNYMDDPVSYEELTEKSFIPEDILWEPGYLWYDNLIVKNEGSLAAKFQAYLIPTSEIGELAEVIDVYVSAVHAFVDTYEGFGDVRQYINGEFKGTGSPWDAYDALNPPTKIGTLAEVMNGQIPLYHDEISLAPANEGDSDEMLIAIALKMQESAGNEYQGKAAGSFDIVFTATQDTHENDSYNNQYDKDAEYPNVINPNKPPISDDTITGGVGEEVDGVNPGGSKTIVLTDDLYIGTETFDAGWLGDYEYSTNKDGGYVFYVKEGAHITLDLGGHTMTLGYTGANYGCSFGVADGGSLTIMNGTLVFADNLVKYAYGVGENATFTIDPSVTVIGTVDQVPND